MIQAQCLQPQWQSAQHVSDIPVYLRPWLLDPGSTTKRFRALGRETFSVQVLKQGWETNFSDERSLLKISARAKTLVREVLIYCNGQAWMFARTIFPASSLTGPNKYLKQALDERPLGDLLYSEPSLRRSEFELSLLQLEPYEFMMDSRVRGYFTEPLWARRSLFFLHDKPILLTEVFLPALVGYCKTKI